MLSVCTNSGRVWQVWNWCVDAYRCHGHTLKFPEATDPVKTYQWRYASRLVKKLEEWEFDDQTSIVFIRFAVGYVKERRLLRKGLAAFFQSNILEVCHDRIENECDTIDRRLELLHASHRFLRGRCQGEPMVDVLLSRPAPDTYYNIVEWYSSHQLSGAYLAISKSCSRALSKVAKLNPNQRKLLPNSSELFCTMLALTGDATLRRQASKILGNDWRQW